MPAWRRVVSTTTVTVTTGVVVRTAAAVTAAAEAAAAADAEAVAAAVAAAVATAAAAAALSRLLGGSYTFLYASSFRPETAQTDVLVSKFRSGPIHYPCEVLFNFNCW